MFIPVFSYASSGTGHGGWTLTEDAMLEVLNHGIQWNAQGLGDWLGRPVEGARGA